METAKILQFEPFTSAVDATFWHLLSNQKVDIYRLDSSPKQLHGYYTSGQVYTQSEAHKSTAAPALFCLGSSAFDGSHPVNVCGALGQLINTNTIEEFKELDKTALFQQVADQIWRDITTGRALKNPDLLNRFILLTFADLKKYLFYYWFAFPALPFPSTAATVHQANSIADALSEQQIIQLQTQYNAFRGSSQSAGFFVVHIQDQQVQVVSPSEWDGTAVQGKQASTFLGFVDPCGLATNPGWPLRNYLMLAKYTWGLHYVRVICYRENVTQSDVKGSIKNSLVLDVVLQVEDIAIQPTPKAVGWEKNTTGKLGPRVINLAPLMDPKRLADSAVDLNLKLMRWRILPDLDLEKISKLKCLLFGAGTLGSYTALALMAWGVRNITFIDNGEISFSNPVRQPLYEFQDCIKQGDQKKLKALVAAERLKKIFPSMNAEGHALTVPMPGHPIPPETRNDAIQTLDTLTRLVKENDALFLLTDSRESRWLPTLLGSAHEKMVINAALGFDTFLVMRHGMSTQSHNLGCYFCNDVVAPVDSLKDRTLDQQCTVTRPGLSQMASGMAVELLMTLTQHPLGAWAPADTLTDPSAPLDSTSLLGLVPHQIRGYLSHFTSKIITGQAYDKCTACSQKILSQYKERGHDFLLQVCDNSGILEEITGLDELQKGMNEAEWDVESESDDF